MPIITATDLCIGKDLVRLFFNLRSEWGVVWLR